MQRLVVAVLCVLLDCDPAHALTRLNANQSGCIGSASSLVRVCSWPLPHGCCCGVLRQSLLAIVVVVLVETSDLVLNL